MKKSTIVGSAIPVAAACVLASVSLPTAAAFPDRFGTYIDNGQGVGFALQTDPVFASVSVSNPAPVWAGSAHAGPSGIGAYTSTNTALADPNPVPGSPPNPPWMVRAGGGAEYYDAMITGTGSSLASPLRLSLDGFLTGAITARPGASVEASISVTSYVEVQVSVFACPHADCAPTVNDISWRNFGIGPARVARTAKVGKAAASCGPAALGIRCQGQTRSTPSSIPIPCCSPSTSPSRSASTSRRGRRRRQLSVFARRPGLHRHRRRGFQPHAGAAGGRAASDAAGR